MGTNFYAEVDCCPTCKRPAESLHIGKSSAGWPFLFRKDPTRNLTTWALWRALLEEPNVTIRDEYGDTRDPQSFKALVENKQGERRATQYETQDPDGYSFSVFDEFS